MSQLVEKSNWDQPIGETLSCGLVRDYVGQCEHEHVDVSKCQFRDLTNRPLIIGITLTSKKRHKKRYFCVHDDTVCHHISHCFPTRACSAFVGCERYLGIVPC